MSTKIFHGFRLPFSDMGRLLAFIERQRLVYRDKAELAATAFIARKAVFAFDEVTLAGTPHVNKVRTKRIQPLFDAYWDLIERGNRVRTECRRDLEIDFEFVLSLFPDGDVTYGIVYCEQAEWCRAFMAEPEVEEYAYCDNTDRPDGLDETAWEARGETWNRILDVKGPGRGIPVLSGLTATIVQGETSGANTDAEALQAAMPSLEARVTRAARISALRALLGEIENPKPGDISRAVYELSTKRLELVELAAAAIRPLLKENLTKDDLLTEFEAENETKTS